MGSTWHDLKLGRRTNQGIRVTQQLTQQELADGAARWACRTWVSGSYGHPRSWDHERCAGERGGMAGSALNPLRSWEIMGENNSLLGR
jgi:hypothetical protein